MPKANFFLLLLGMEVFFSLQVWMLIFLLVSLLFE